MIKKLDSFTKIGIYKNTLNREIKRIKIINYCCLIGIINGVFFLIAEILLNQLVLINAASYFIQLLTFIFIILLQKRKKYIVARFLFILLCFLTLTYNANYAYRGFYGEYMYILLPLAALFFFDKKWIYTLVLILCIFLFYVPNYYLAIYPEKYFGYLNGLFLFLGTFFTVYYFKSQNQKNEKSLEEAYLKLEEQKKSEFAYLQLKALKAQMNPHFIFNALNSIQDYIVLNQKNLAADYLGKFADLIRNYLHFSDTGFISVTEEIHSLNLYLELEKLRFEDQLEYVFQVDDAADFEAILIPTMLVQPFVENALKHGLLHKKNNRKLKISIRKSSDNIIECIIEDNGVGREKAKEINKKRELNHRSFALKATTERLDLLNYGLDKKYGVNIIDLLENNQATGTKVILKIPILKKVT